jgi:hypothetical protein
MKYATQDRDEIVRWAARRDGFAASVAGAHKDASADAEPDVGALRIGFPGYASEEALEPLSWEAFFEAFYERDLTFYYDDQEPGGTPSYRYHIE